MSAPIAWITGGSRGLGRALVKQLFANGYSVYFTGRDRLMLDTLGEELDNMSADRSDVSLGSWHGIVVDHGDLQQISSVDNVISSVPKLDLLVNNAGIIPRELATTRQGFEQGFGVNYLSHFLLTQKLWSKLLLSQQARIINVSSLAFGNGVIDWQQPRAWPNDGWQAYSNSKLALILFTHALAQRSQSTFITVNSVCPGIVNTNLLKNHPLFPPSMLTRLSSAMQESDTAAEYLFWLSTAQELEKISGKFFSRSQAGQQPLTLSINDALAEKLWQASLEWTKDFSSMPNVLRDELTSVVPSENPWVT